MAPVILWLVTSIAVLAAAQSSTSSSAAPAPTAVTDCHLHGDVQYCFDANNNEYEVIDGPTGDNVPEEYTECHSHGDELHCSGDGLDVTLVAEGSEEDAHSHEDHDHEEEEPASAEGIFCHFHAGVEHCVDAEGNTVKSGCSRPDHDYNVPLRVGLLFVILVTSAIGVFVPIITARFSSIRTDHIVFIGLRQFGTGIVISTALVHLFTHAQIYFDNECLGGLEYEATTAAIVVAGLLVTFLIEVLSHRAFGKRNTIESATSSAGDDKSPASSGSEIVTVEKAHARAMTINTAVIEAGIIFHSILLGVVLVVAGDSAFITLFVVILFHQAFEGVALGTLIAIMPSGLMRKIVLGLAFAITTPIGMAIGIGVLTEFNGNDPSTIIAIGTFNAFSAGILLWIGITEMWFKEWWYGPLAHAGNAKTLVGFFGLVLGLVLMSLLGKWA